MSKAHREKMGAEQWLTEDFIDKIKDVEILNPEQFEGLSGRDLAEMTAIVTQMAKAWDSVEDLNDKTGLKPEDRYDITDELRKSLRGK